MEFFRIHRDMPLMQRALIFNAISLITFLAAVFFLVHRGLHLSVEFTGGTVVEVQYPQAVPTRTGARHDGARSVIPTRRCRTSAPRATC